MPGLLLGTMIGYICGLIRNSWYFDQEDQSWENKHCDCYTCNEATQQKKFIDNLYKL